MKRRIEVLVEAERTIVATSGGKRSNQWCEPCAATVAFATPQHASVIYDVPTRVIYRWIEQGEIHFIDSERDPAVCLPSLMVVVKR